MNSPNFKTQTGKIRLVGHETGHIERSTDFVVVFEM